MIASVSEQGQLLHVESSKITLTLDSNIITAEFLPAFGDLDLTQEHISLTVYKVDVYSVSQMDSMLIPINLHAILPSEHNSGSICLWENALVSGNEVTTTTHSFDGIYQRLESMDTAPHITTLYDTTPRLPPPTVGLDRHQGQYCYNASFSNTHSNVYTDQQLLQQQQHSHIHSVPISSVVRLPPKNQH